MVETGEDRSVTDATSTGAAPPAPSPSATPSTGRLGAMKARVQATREAAIETLESTRQRSRIVDACSTIVLRPRIVADTILASYVALRAFILLFPLAYLVVAGFGIYTKDASGDPVEVAKDVGLAPAITSSIAEASQTSSRGHWLVLIVGLMGTLWAARGLWRALRGMFAIIWRLPIPKTSASLVGPFFIATGIAALVLLGSWFDKLRRDGTPWWLVSLLSLGLVGAMWLATSLALPHASGRWYHLLPGALVFGVGLQSLNVATALYFGPKAGKASAAYGVLGIGLVLLSWLIVLGWVVALSAEVNAGLHYWRTRGSDDAGRMEAADAANRTRVAEGIG